MAAVITLTPKPLNPKALSPQEFLNSHNRGSILNYMVSLSRSERTSRAEKPLRRDAKPESSDARGFDVGILFLFFTTKPQPENTSRFMGLGFRALGLWV